MIKLVGKRHLLALVAGVMILATAMLLLAPQPAAASCEDCYQKFIWFVGWRAFCCPTGGAACSSFESNNYTKILSNVSDCGVYVPLAQNGTMCHNYGNPCGSGSGGTGGGGGGGGGDECVIGPADPYCDVGCSSCFWDPWYF